MSNCKSSDVRNLTGKVFRVGKIRLEFWGGMFSVMPGLTSSGELFTSLSTLISSFIHVSANCIISFFLMADSYSIVCKYHISFIHSSVNGHLGPSIL